MRKCSWKVGGLINFGSKSFDRVRRNLDLFGSLLPISLLDRFANTGQSLHPVAGIKPGSVNQRRGKAECALFHCFANELLHALEFCCGGRAVSVASECGRWRTAGTWRARLSGS